MGHRHLPNSFTVLTGQSQNSNNGTSEHPYAERVIDLEHGSLAYPVDTVSRAGVQPASHWNSERMRNDYPSSSFGMGVPNMQPAYSGTSHDPFPNSLDPASSYQPPERSTGFSQSYYYDRCYGYEYEQGYVAESARRHLKRRSPGTTAANERGSTTRFPVAGSSSTFSGQPQERPTSNYQENQYDLIGFTHNGGAPRFSAGEGSSRNVRRRTELGSLSNPQPTQLSGYPSHYYHASNVSTYHEGVEPNNMGADRNTRQWNVDPLPPAHGRIHTSGSGGSSNENSHLLPRGNGREIHAIGSVPSGNLISSSTYLYESPIPVAVESYANHRQMEVPAYSTGLSYSSLGGEASSRPSTANSLPSLPSVSEAYTPGQSRQSVGGWRNNHRTGRSRVAIERFHTFSGIADAHSRNGSQSFNMMMDHSAFYASSRDLFDQHEDMRLDVDNMSYEELIALGEQIGNVNTGVSNDMISKCLTEKVCSSDQYDEEESCPICLEEYRGEEMVGTMKKCGHSYHVKCIRHWLSMKNVCPICKAPALTDCSNKE